MNVLSHFANICCVKVCKFPEAKDGINLIEDTLQLLKCFIKHIQLKNVNTQMKGCVEKSSKCHPINY